MTDNADLDAVLAAMSNTLEVGCESGLAAEHPHYVKFKNYGAEEKRQRERRDEWLKRQKEGRANLFDKRRSNVTHEDESMNEAVPTEEENMEQATESTLVEMQDKTGTSATKPGSWKKHMQTERARHQRLDLKDRLMYGEWLVDVPEDFSAEWRMVPTPKGKRCSVVFGQKNCQMYNKNGVQIHNISISTNISPPVICDALVSGTTVYILDFVEIEPFNIESCDFDCRRYLGKTFLSENKILKATDKYKKWNFQMLEATPDCSRETIEHFASEPTTFEQDGLMFYHKEGYYTPGVTPLVNWLKPWMLAGQKGCLLSVMDGVCSEIDIELPKPGF